MSNAVKYHFEDFTHAHYRELLELARERFRFVHYPEMNAQEAQILWRHDVDFSVHEALRLAAIEQAAGVKSTFFLLLSSEFYNLFEKDIRKRVQQIIALGHAIGLHFDPTLYPINTEQELEHYLLEEKAILEKLCGVPVQVFSFHNPTAGTLENDKDTYAGLINTYAASIKQQYTYCSDSNGIWRFRRLKEVITDPESRRLQILTHPEWWTSEVMSPRQKVLHCINGRARYVLEQHEQALAAFGRNMIDWE